MSALFTLALVLGFVAACATAQLAPDSPFPYCECDRASVGPYKLRFRRREPFANGDVKYCYTISTNKGSTAGPCAKYDLRKIEWDVSTSCRNAVKRATFNKSEVSTSFSSFNNGKSTTFKVLRPGGNLASYKSLEGRKTWVCFVVKPGPCSTRLSNFVKRGQFSFFSPDNKCCTGQPMSPPPPPPSPSPEPPSEYAPGDLAPPTPPPEPEGGKGIEAFPYHSCSYSGTSSPYTLTALPTEDASGKYTTYCFNLKTQAAPRAGKKCAAFALRKIEIAMDRKCQGAVEVVTFGNKRLSASYQRYPAKSDVFKITHGTTNLASFESLEGKETLVCLKMLNSICNLNTFCQGKECNVAYFSTKNTCCPSRMVPA